MMDCDTTGVEPDIALVKYKQLAGGGMLKIVNRTVPMALRKLGYDEPVIRSIFDYAFPPPQGGRSIHFRGHLRMMAAVQPFLSGAISKCVVGETLVATTEGLVRIGGLYGGESPDSFRES